MPTLAALDAGEAASFLHLLRNKGRSMDNVEARTNALIDAACSDHIKKELAQVSEDENFALKNRHRFQKTTMDYADQSKMPIESEKVVDLLRHSNVFKHKIIHEV